MGLIDGIRKDVEAGTPGPWIKGRDQGIVTLSDMPQRKHVAVVVAANMTPEPDARRIARVPDMEAALLAAEELANSIVTYQKAEFDAAESGSEDDYYAVFDAWEQVETALAAYRKATGVEE